MKYWGKIFGGIGGFAIGGPIGGVLGAMLGHAVDEESIPNLPKFSWSNPLASLAGLTAKRARVAAMLGRRDQVFTFSVVALSAKLSKSDGPVKRSEIDAFKRHFHINPESTREVGKLFDKARDSHETVEDLAAPLGEAFANNRALLEEVMIALYAIAMADGPLNAPEREFLGRTHRALGLDHVSWNRVNEEQDIYNEAPEHDWKAHEQRAREARDRYSHANQSSQNKASGGQQSGARSGSQQRRRAEDQQREHAYAKKPARPAEPTPYQILGVSPLASDEDIRNVWRKLMRENHPDRLAAQNVPKEFIAKASDKVARINAAYDKIKRERGL